MYYVDVIVHVNIEKAVQNVLNDMSCDVKCVHVYMYDIVSMYVCLQCVQVQKSIVK